MCCRQFANLILLNLRDIKIRYKMLQRLPRFVYECCANLVVRKSRGEVNNVLFGKFITVKNMRH